MKSVLLKTIPIVMGYVFLGSAFGILAQSVGLPFWVPLTMSIFIYAGAMQFATIPLLLNPISAIQTFILAISINARHLFYGLAMMHLFNKAGNKKHYLRFSLTDETFSLIANMKNVDEIFWISFLNQMYWILGTILGYLFGSFIPIPTQGIEFAMTALFLIIFTDAILDQKILPSFVGLGVSAVCLLIFGPQYFIIPSMILITITFTIRRKA